MTKRHAYPDIEAVRELPALTSQVIPGRWEDQNGHINVSYYMALYNESGWPMFDLMGVDESYFTERKMGFVDLANHISYLNELHVGDRVTAYGRFLGFDSKRLHGMVLTVNDDTGKLASTIEFLAISMDLARRRAAPIPDDIAARLEAITRAHQALRWSVPTCMSVPA
jgi:acyl-CoA thioester hydrolase